MGPIVLVGACIRVYVNNKLYKEVQQISYNKDYGEYAIHGIDTPHPQEIASGGKTSITGTISGLRIRYSGGIQAYNIRPLLKDILAAPYISIRIQDRSTKEDVLFIPNAKISGEAATTRVKGGFSLTFNFLGTVAFEPLDRA